MPDSDASGAASGSGLFQTLDGEKNRGGSGPLRGFDPLEGSSPLGPLGPVEVSCPLGPLGPLEGSGSFGGSGPLGAGGAGGAGVGAMPPSEGSPPFGLSGPALGGAGGWTAGKLDDTGAGGCVGSLGASRRAPAGRGADGLATVRAQLKVRLRR